ncbi:hypothetical protein [Paenibacillus sp.]|uniref:hypothetical protein n=1 Tax=Paenibacillus sp. TaxID=58172 RepID=UPI0028120CF0|nr:hypothetical protein [Paenibacillus sp.]
MEKVLNGSVGGKMKQQALWFIQLEKERILHNYLSGCASKDQAVGGLNTLYQIASYLHDKDVMKNLWLSIVDIQNARFPGLRSSGAPGTIGL